MKKELWLPLAIALAGESMPIKAVEDLTKKVGRKKCIIKKKKKLRAQQKQSRKKNRKK